MTLTIFSSPSIASHSLCVCVCVCKRMCVCAQSVLQACLPQGSLCVSVWNRGRCCLHPDHPNALQMDFTYTQSRNKLMATVLEVVNYNVLPACFQEPLRGNGEIILTMCSYGHPSVSPVRFSIKEDALFPRLFPVVIMKLSIYWPCTSGDSLSFRMTDKGKNSGYRAFTSAYLWSTFTSVFLGVDTRCIER